MKNPRAWRSLLRFKEPVFESAEVFHELGNMFWKTCIAEGVTPRAFAEKEMVPRPDSLQGFMILMKMAFNPEAARDMKAAVQFNFCGDIHGACRLTIDHGAIQVREGTGPNPDVVIETPFEVWMDILTRKANGQEMFMQQKYTVQGDLNLLLRMGKLFGNG